ncbi:MAG: YihY/virulence factor BrkB family protein [Geodermatophilaceae bacterium]|nr:YihY/virulence factor BrkB family protein [Geodermatophilaceae bacterium]
MKQRLVWLTSRRWVKHLGRAVSHYLDRQADLLAAGITYFGFLALFPVILLAVSVAGFVLSGRPDLQADLIDKIRVAVPGDLGEQLVDAVQTAIDNSGTVGVIGLVGLLYAGIGWMSKMRVAMQTIWRGQPLLGNFVKDKLRDLIALVGLGGALLASVALTAVANGLTSLVLELLGLDGVPGIGVLTRALGIVVAIAGTTLIFLWLFIRLPQLKVPVRAVLPGAIFGAVGFEVLKLVGTYYLTIVAQSPAAAVFTSAIGLLVWIYFSSRFLLFAAAWTSTLPAVSERIVTEAAEGQPLEPLVEGPAVPRLKPPVPGVPSTSAVAAGLMGVGAVVGAVAPSAVRRWWRAGRR